MRFLHLLAMAHEAEVPLDSDDFTEIGKRVPVLCDLKPSGKYNMSHFVRIGGLRPCSKPCSKQGLLHGECMTVTGKTLAENVSDATPYAPYPRGRTWYGLLMTPSKKIVTFAFFMATLPPTVRLLRLLERKD